MALVRNTKESRNFRLPETVSAPAATARLAIGPLLVFRNDGASSRVAKCSAVKTYSSGPRGGVEGTRALANHYGLDDVVMLDVGGTTTDLAVVRAGQVDVDDHGRIAGVTTSLPLARITSRGIGGSSVFRVTAGRVTVGPDSVGAAPGPACFGLGGTDPTISDVLLLTGVLNAETYLGGSMRLDGSRSETAVRATIADPLGVDVPQALRFMLDAYADRLAEALRPVVSPRTTIAAFGGAGPMSICAVARRVGVSRILIPRTAAVFSAFGIGFSDIGQTYSAALPPPGDEQDGVREDLLGRARRDMFAEGIDLADCEVRWSHDEELGRLRLNVTSVLPHPHLLDSGDAEPGAVVSDGVRRVLPEGDQRTDVPVVVVADQVPGAVGKGPAVIEGPFFTMLLPADWRMRLTAGGDLLLTDLSIQATDEATDEEARR